MLSFALDPDFLKLYETQEPFWGFTDSGGNSMGELAFVRSYSHVKPDGRKEQWWEVCKRVTEGTYHEQKRWCRDHRITWTDAQGQESAQEFFDHMFYRRWAPPGRGLQMMGTKIVHEIHDSTPLQNCAAIRTDDFDEASGPGDPFGWTMEASMLGVGVGFDTSGADLGLTIVHPLEAVENYVVDDTREAWADSVRRLVNSYLISGQRQLKFDYSQIRPAGSIISTFGGFASGPGALEWAHEMIRSLLNSRVGEVYSSRVIVDAMNIIGKTVVMGNTRRTAEIAVGRADDKDFITIKDWRLPQNNERLAKDTGWGYTSNNSIIASVGMDYTHVLEQITFGGEPGLLWMDVTNTRGRLADPPRADNADLYNPCAEQPLKSREMCTLVNVYPPNCNSYEQYLRVLKFAYLYAKTVTLIPTRWEKTNTIMQRHRRIGTSFNGAWQMVEQHGWLELDRWMDNGYGEVQRWDGVYSNWLCVRESIRTTTVKPDGTGSLLAGTTPGAHPSPGSEYYLRRITYQREDPVVPLLIEAGYRVEPKISEPERSVVAAFPVASPTGVRPQDQASVYEKVHLAVRMQRLWSDNSVSLTLTYTPDEKKELGNVLRMFEGQLKSISFLELATGQYEQMPYEAITREEYEEYSKTLKPIDCDALYRVQTDIEMETGCTTDACEIKYERPVQSSAR